MTDAILIPTLVAAAACFATVGITHAIIAIVRRILK